MKAARPWAPAIVAVLLATARAGASEPPTIVLARAVGKSVVMADAERRIVAELAVEGYTVRPVDQRPVDAATLARELDADGALVLGTAISNGAGAWSITLDSLDATDGSWQRRDVVVDDGPDGGAVLAIRAVELLHAHFLLRRIAARSSDATVAARAPSIPAVVEPSPAPPPRSRVTFELAGEGQLDPRADATVTFGPALRLAWLGTRWGARLAIVPTTSSIQVAATEAEAHARQRSITLDAVVLSRPAAVRVHAGLGAALVRVEATGQADTPYRGITTTGTTPALRGAAGLTWWTTSRIGVAAELGALVTAAPLDVTIDGRERRTLGRPWLFASIGIVVGGEGPK